MKQHSVMENDAKIMNKFNFKRLPDSFVTNCISRETSTNTLQEKKEP